MEYLLRLNYRNSIEMALNLNFVLSFCIDRNYRWGSHWHGVGYGIQTIL